MSATANFAQGLDDDVDRLARKRVSRKLGWYIHAFVFVTVNLGLAALAAFSGRHGVAFPSMGWGLGLLIHGLVVFVFMPGNAWRERMVQRERAHLTTLLRTQRDPW